jgi:3-oxoacyl-[acyl-carrier-protein] synthase III
LTNQGVRIAGIAHYVPERVLTNSDFERMLDTSDDWIVTRTGMRERHIARDDESTSDMALVAARGAIERAGLVPADIQCVILATVTPDYIFPATACILANKLGLDSVPAFDIEIACSGFIYGLTVASSLIRSGVYQRILLVGVEKLSGITNYEERSTAILFGDGAGAAVLEASEVDSFLSAELGADGSNPSALYIPVGGTVEPLTATAIAEKRNKIAMNGREVFRLAVTKMIESAEIALAKANLTIDDIDFLIPHQANRRIIEAAAKLLDLPPERVIINIDRYGNTSAASIPIALSEAHDAGRLADGDLLLFLGFGGGLSWGAVTWRWANGSSR